MTELMFINEEEGRVLIEGLVREQAEKGISLIKNGPGFAGHCLSTAKKGAYLAKRVEGNTKLNSQIQYAAGIFHDAGKIFEPDPFHEVVGAYEVLKNGEKYGLVCGGDPGERKTMLSLIANCIIADGPVYEEWTQELYKGEPEMPEKSHDGEKGIKRVTERLDYLMKTLYSSGKLESLLLPGKPSQKIALVADMADVDFEKATLGGMKARFEDIIKRYSDPNHADYNPVGAKVAKMVMPRYLQVLEDVSVLTGMPIIE